MNFKKIARIFLVVLGSVLIGLGIKHSFEVVHRNLSYVCRNLGTGSIEGEMIISTVILVLGVLLIGLAVLDTERLT